MTPPVHLVPERSERGFARLPVIPSEYGGDVRVQESSAAEGPHVWVGIKCPVNLNDPDGPTINATVHLTAENAWKLHEQLEVVVRNHYQGDAVPEWAQHP